MRKSVKLLSLLLLGGALFMGCSGNEDQDVQLEEEILGEYVYEYDASTSKVEFTAFKFVTNRAGVGGSFNEFEMEAEAGVSPLDVISSLKINIPTSSVNTKDEGRDAKISEFFFQVAEISNISGYFAEIREEEGKAIMALTMNNITHNVTGEYTLSDENVFVFNASINVEDWGAHSGIEALNNECHDLHIGPDDEESKLWSDVEISFTTTLSQVEK